MKKTINSNIEHMTIQHKNFLIQLFMILLNQMISMFGFFLKTLL
jgi:hypothetical protein